MDINLAASNPWMASTLQFVAGLGPRKARALVQVRAPGLLPRSVSPLLHLRCVRSGQSTSFLQAMPLAAQLLWREAVPAFGFLGADTSSGLHV